MYDLPESWFIHSVQYDIEESDGWQAVQADSSSIGVTGVRISANQGFLKSKDNEADTSTSVMYVSPKYSSFTDFAKGNYVTYDGVRYLITKIHRYTQPTSDKVHHWRLELV